MKLWKPITVGLLCLSATGCIMPKSYVDPKYKDIEVGQLKLVENKHHANIDIEFQRNGERFTRADKLLRTNVEKILLDSGVVVPSADPQRITIKVICNNIADLKAARAKGFGTGLTFGAKGSAVTDFYQVTIELKQGDKVIEKKYDHALHTTIGNAEAPVEGVEPTNPNEAFGGVIEDVILQFIKDMQAQNILTLEALFLKKQA